MNIKLEKHTFEGAQGGMLDIDFGIYPFVTSSNTISGALSAGSGFSFRKVNKVIGVFKAYQSKVGSGPFPTEILNDSTLRDLGNEYGTTTGRPRRVGWLDIPLLKYTSMLNDVDCLAITKQIYLGSLKNKSCHIIYLNGREINYYPKTFLTLTILRLNMWNLMAGGILMLKNNKRGL